MDQIGNYVLPSNGHTFHTRGAKQVDIVAKDEKCACTLTVGSSMSGVSLPFQQIWGGATDKVRPSVQAPRMADAIKCGFDFTFAKSMKKGNHYSTSKTMKEVSANLGYLHNLTDTNLAVDQENICSLQMKCH
jgi:hypothetical protein